MSRKVPTKEADLVAFVKVIIDGLKKNTDIFKNPPLTYEQLSNSTDNVKLAINNVAQNKLSYKEAITAKNIKVQTLYKNAVQITDYCYKISEDDKILLKKVGLTPRSEKKPAEHPGRIRDFKVVKQGIGKVTFKWKQPESGGKARVYIIQRKKAGASTKVWENVWTSIGKEAEIKNQPEGKIFEYRVHGLNIAGIGAPSNTVTVKF